MSNIYYKAFNRDQTCRGMKYEEGNTYEVEGKPVICNHGLHFCKHLVLTLEYYAIKESITENLYAEVEALGDIDWEMPTKHKGCTNKLRVIRFLSDDEVKAISDGKYNSGHRNSGHSNSGDWNSGHWNSGHRNSGDSNSGDSNSGDRNSGHSNSGHWNSGHWNSGHSNSGDRNSGHRNSGHWNSGHWNSGHWNSCDYETGCFNSKQSKKIMVFNKECSRKKWEDANKPSFLYFQIQEGKTYKESFIDAYDNSSSQEKDMLKKLPNFDAKVFFEISGIKVK